MKKISVALFLLIFFQMSIMGCGTVYKVAVDQRKVTTQIEDEKITMAIRGDIVEDSGLKLLDTSIYCYGGHVYLVGEYERIEQTHRIVKIANAVEGVKSVTTHFLPKRKGDLCGTTDNLKFKTTVKVKLIGDEDISSTNIEVKSLQCHIVLLGLVESQIQIKKAIDHAKSIKGVRGVKSFLKIAR